MPNRREMFLITCVATIVAVTVVFAFRLFDAEQNVAITAAITGAVTSAFTVGLIESRRARRRTRS